MPNPQVNVVSSSTPPQLAVVEYEAWVRLDLERSELTFNPRATEQMIRQALTTAPTWTNITWPPQWNNRGTELLFWALVKMKLVLDDKDDLPSGSYGQLSAAMRQRYRAVFNADPPGLRARFALARANVMIWEDGGAQWGGSVPQVGELPPGLSDKSETRELPSGQIASRPCSYHVFLKHVMKADILRRIEALQQP